MNVTKTKRLCLIYEKDLNVSCWCNRLVVANVWILATLRLFNFLLNVNDNDLLGKRLWRIRIKRHRHDSSHSNDIRLAQVVTWRKKRKLFVGWCNWHCIRFFRETPAKQSLISSVIDKRLIGRVESNFDSGTSSLNWRLLLPFLFTVCWAFQHCRIFISWCFNKIIEKWPSIFR